jgi:hypothetical protein
MNHFRNKRKTDVISVGVWVGFQGFLYGQAGIFGHPRDVDLLS